MTDEAVDRFLVFLQDSIDLGVPFAVLWDVRRESFPTMKHLRKVISWLDEGDRAAVWDSRVTCHYLVLRNPIVRAGIGLMARVANAPQPVRCASSDAEALVFAQACAQPARVFSARDAEMRARDRAEPAAEVLSASAQSAEAASAQSAEAASDQSAEAARVAVVQSAEAAAQLAPGAPPSRTSSHAAAMDPGATPSPGSHAAAMDPGATLSPAGAPPSPRDDAPSLQHETALPSQVKSSQVKSSQVKSSQVKSSQVKSSQVKASHETALHVTGPHDEAEAQRRIRIGGDEAEAQRRIRIGQLELRWPRQRSGA